MRETRKHECNHSGKEGEHECFEGRLGEIVQQGNFRDFALRAKISPQALRKYINGESTPNVERLIMIAHAGGVSVQWLATGEEVQEKVKHIEVPVVAPAANNQIDRKKIEDILFQLKRAHRLYENPIASVVTRQVVEIYNAVCHLSDRNEALVSIDKTIELMLLSLKKSLEEAMQEEGK